MAVDSFVVRRVCCCVCMIRLLCRIRFWTNFLVGFERCLLTQWPKIRCTFMHLAIATSSTAKTTVEWVNSHDLGMQNRQLKANNGIEIYLDGHLTYASQSCQPTKSLTTTFEVTKPRARLWSEFMPRLRR